LVSVTFARVDPFSGTLCDQDPAVFIALYYQCIQNDASGSE